MGQCKEIQRFEYKSCVEFAEEEAETHETRVDDSDGLEG